MKTKTGSNKYAAKTNVETCIWSYRKLKALRVKIKKKKKKKKNNKHQRFEMGKVLLFGGQMMIEKQAHPELLCYFTIFYETEKTTKFWKWNVYFEHEKNNEMFSQYYNIIL